MNIKEQILKELDIDYTDNTPDTGLSPRIYHLNDDQLDAFVDLVLNALTIEKETTIGVGHSYRMDGFNECVNAYEELKNKLRK